MFIVRFPGYGFTAQIDERMHWGLVEGEDETALLDILNACHGGPDYVPLTLAYAPQLHGRAANDAANVWGGEIVYIDPPESEDGVIY